MMKQILFLLVFTLSSVCVYCQEPHEHPDHPKGNSAQMYKALPLYNEACELYKLNQIERAKRSLYEAISISYALTEAHLFLADIMLEQGKIDSAFYFYNSGLDFAIEQKPNYYFKLFDLGMKLGQYHIVKHNLKHFNKLYGDKKDETPYETDFPYTRSDYEKYKESIDFVYDYQSWLPTANQQKEQLVNGMVESSYAVGKSVFSRENGQTVEYIQKRKRIKKKVVRGIPAKAGECAFSFDKSYALYTLTEEGKTKIYVAKRKGSKYLEGKELPIEINTGSFNGYPFLTKDNSTLYFSSNRSGSKDLFVAHIDLNTNTVSDIKELDRVNSAGDEIAPYLNESTNAFYLSSNGYRGFGGFDLYECVDYEKIDNTIFPIVPRNMGASFNTFHDDVQVSINALEEYVLLRNLRDSNSAILYMTAKKPFEQIYFEIDFFPANTNE